MVKKENLGFAFMALGMVVTALALIFIPLQNTLPTIPFKASPLVAKAEPFTPQEHVLVAAYRHGWTGAQWDCLKRLITIENPGWLPNRKNPKSTASGLFQVLRSASGVMFRDYSVEDQSRLGMKYIAHRYKTPCRALTFHMANGYF